MSRTSWFVRCFPPNRQTEIFTRHGVTLAREPLCGWVAAAADLLTAPYDSADIVYPYAPDRTPAEPVAFLVEFRVCRYE